MEAQYLPAPLELRNYLKSRGWYLNKAGLKHQIFVLESAQFPGRQLVFPMDEAAPDYPEAVSLAVEKIAELTGVSAKRVLEGVQFSGDDVLRIRVVAGADQNRFIPLKYASELVGAAARLLKAAACNVVRPRLNHPRLALSEAAQLIEKGRFGHTEPGSFVLKVAIPVFALDHQGVLELEDTPPPFVRQVMESVIEGSQALVNAIAMDEIESLLEGLKVSERPGLSSNFCEALGQIYDDTLDNSCELLLDWSELVQSRTEQPSRVVIPRDYFPRIHEIGRELKAIQKAEQETLLGTVEKLEGEMGEDGRRSGDVVLSLLTPDGEPLFARVHLNSDQYEVADRAHMQTGVFVKVTGLLNPGRQPRRLAPMSDFSVVYESVGVVGGGGERRSA